MSEGTVIEAFSANVVDTRFEDFENDTVELAKNRIIDVLGCLIGGSHAPGNEALLRLIRKWGGREESTILVHGGKAPAQNVATLNTIMARSFDFEVMSYVINGQSFASHHAATLVPTALALGELAGADGKEVITAMLVGDDMAARVQTASKGHPIGLGWDGCGTLSHLGATATASRLLGLDKAQTRNAFGIVLNTIASAIQSLWDGATTFKLGQGTAARNGIFSAELAKEGWTGVEDSLLSRFGYFFLYAGGCKDPDIMTNELGKKYYGEAYFKPYPCGMPNHVAIDCALEMVREYNIKAGDIEEVIIYVPHGAISTSYYAKPFIIRDFPHGDAIFSYPYSVATALLHGSVDLSNYTDEAIRDPMVNAITANTKLVELSDDGRPRRMGVKLTVKMRNGKEYTIARKPNREWTKRPTPRDEIKAKFRHQVDFAKTVNKENAEKLLVLIEKLEEVEDIRDITKLIIG
ncbi:MAG: MmgE/PrpD family protein [Deltaproteobacteria bacterium]|nr:MmgE/PrpD family protein [Deltaproteobacteria bacterium]